MRVRYLFSSHRTGNLKNIRKQKQKFPDVVEEVIRISDIILEIVDGRFIDETRNLELEKEVFLQGKKLVIVLNKSDLVKNRGKIPKGAIEVSCKERKGIAKLRNKIKEEAGKVDTDYGRIQVGIVGYPNTGKSSLINLLIGKSSAKTGAQAGFTKGMQKLKLTSSILILDTPGVIPPSEYSHNKKEAIQKQAKVGARTIDKIRQPEIVVDSLFDESKEILKKFYNVNAEDSEEFIEKVAKKKGFLKKGGHPDEDRTARQIIVDWQEGKI